MSPLENVLAEEIQYLRKQIEHRDETIAKKDKLIDELTRRLTKLDIIDGAAAGANNIGVPMPMPMPMPMDSGPRRTGENPADADRWHRELDRTFQELRGLLARRPSTKG